MTYRIILAAVLSGAATASALFTFKLAIRFGGI